MMIAMLRRSSYRYVCHKELQAIKDKYGDSRIEQVKMWLHHFRHRASVGIKHMRSDLHTYYEVLRKL